jgi:hypothetical protein
MSLLHAVLKTPNPFPHGLFWTGMKGYGIPQSVDALLNAAQQAGVNAHYVEVETFDSLMLRLWRNTSEKTAELDRKVRKTEASVVSIPFGKIGSGSPLIRLNGLPILSLPTQCQAITFSHSKEWSALRTATAKTEGRLIFTKAEAVWCWGEPGLVREEFKDVTAISPVDLAPFLSVLAKHLHLKGFLEQALCSALSKGKPLLCRTTRTASFLIADRYAEDHLALEPLRQIVPKLFADIPGAFCPSDEKHPHREQISFAEAVRISIDERDGKQWLLLNPDVWIWPTRAREHATEFLDQRRKTRRNDKMNELLDAWIAVILGATKKSAEITLAPFEKGTPAENPAFTIGTRTAFARRSLP